MTYQPTTAEFAARLTLILSDPALTASLKTQCPALAALIDAGSDPVRKVQPLPSADAITAAQATLWDNWPSGRRAARYPNRYAVTLKVWTTDDVRLTGKGNHNHEVTSSLMDTKALTKWIKDKRKTVLKNPISPAYLNLLASVAETMGEDDLVGLFCAKAEGTVFFDHQWLWMKRIGTEWQATLSINGNGVVLPSFDTTYANGSPLGGNGIGQSRLDLCGFSTSWATAPMDNVVQFRAA